MGLARYFALFTEYVGGDKTFDEFRFNRIKMYEMYGLGPDHIDMILFVLGIRFSRGDELRDESRD